MIKVPNVRWVYKMTEDIKGMTPTIKTDFSLFFFYCKIKSYLLFSLTGESVWLRPAGGRSSLGFYHLCRISPEEEETSGRKSLNTVRSLDPCVSHENAPRQTPFKNQPS